MERKVDSGTSWWMHAAQHGRPAPVGRLLASLACLALVGAASAREFSFIAIGSARTASVQVYGIAEVEALLTVAMLCSASTRSMRNANQSASGLTHRT
jgi:hypothetical protein